MKRKKFESYQTGGFFVLLTVLSYVQRNVAISLKYGETANKKFNQAALK